MSRRTMLKGVGAAIALPLLDVMEPVAVAAANLATKPTNRLAYLYFPNGIAGDIWTPERLGANGEILEVNKWMKPLQPFVSDMIIPANLWTPQGNGHGAGSATWLTGSGFNRREIKVGNGSIDQLVGQQIGEDTLLPTLELSLKGEGFFSKNLSRNIMSWTPEGRPVPREVEPRVVFDRMFRTSRKGVSEKSVLDLVLDNAKTLQRRVSTNDKRKVDEYFDSIRTIERRIEFASKQSQRAIKDQQLTDSLQRPEPGIPTSHKDYLRVMFDMMVMSFWADATRVCTFMLDHGQSNRYFNFVDGIKGTWHALSHYQDASGRTEDDDGVTSWDSVASKRDMFAKVTEYHHEQVAYFLNRMKSIKEGDKTLLDNSMIVYGSSLSDGNEHSAENLPLIVAGGGAGTLKPGRYIKYGEETDMSKLHLGLARRMGAKMESFGGVSEELDNLS